jgi:CubicO group peptidase (beta-lactamase class C family)
MFQLRYTAMLLLLGAPVPLRSQPAPVAPSIKPAPTAEEALEGFDAFAEATVKAWKVPGVAISVVKDGKIVLSRGYGTRDPATGLPMTKDTIFPIGSMTKAFTSFGLGLLVDEGKVEFDRPVSDYLPDLKLHNQLASSELTLRDMLSHRTGLPRHDMVWIQNRALTREALIDRVPHLAPSAPFRTSWQYNNIMYTLAGLAVDRLSGTSWESFTADRVLKPLGMTRSTLLPDVALADPDHVGASQAHGKGHVNLPLFRSFPAMTPAGGVYSTADDLARWMLVHLSYGVHGEKQIIRRATLGQITRPSMIAASPDHPEVVTTSYGLAWFNSTFRGERMVWHNGGLPGISTIATFLPGKNLGVTVLANQAPTELHVALTRVLLDRFLGLKPIDWTGDALKRKQAGESKAALASADGDAGKVAGTSPSHRLEAYAGTYLHPGYGAVTVSQAGGKLIARYNDDSSPMKHFHYDVFEATTVDSMSILLGARMQFMMDGEGRISSISMPLEAALPPIVFSKQPDAKLGDPNHLATLAGTYTTKAGKVVASVVGNKLQLLPEGGQPMQLIPGIDGEYTHAQRRDIRLRFQRDKAGRITGYTFLDANGAVEAKRAD